MNPTVAELLYDKECPYDYKCLSMDCMECMKLHMESKENEDV